MDWSRGSEDDQVVWVLFVVLLEAPHSRLVLCSKQVVLAVWQRAYQSRPLLCIVEVGHMVNITQEQPSIEKCR